MNGQLPEGATPVTLTPNETQAVRDTAIIEALNWILEVLPESSEATSRVKTLMQGIVATISIHQVDPSAGEVTADAAFEISKDFSRLLAALQEIVVADTEARKVDFFADSGAAAATRRVEALAAGRELVDEFIKPLTSIDDARVTLGVDIAASGEVVTTLDDPSGDSGILNRTAPADVPFSETVKTIETESGWAGWECTKCSHQMRSHFRTCPVCNYTVFKPLTADELAPKAEVDRG